ncbi:MAG: HAD family hydrolase [Omnitrophica WOR_2 bacterium]
MIKDPTIKALIFDFDGLILDTERPIYQSWKEIYESFGSQLHLSDWANVIGAGPKMHDLYALLEKQLGYPVQREQVGAPRKQREVELIEAQEVLPGVRETLESAKKLGLKIGLASSSSCKWVTGHLSRLGLLDYFDVIRAEDDVAYTKPDPELYLKVIEAFSLHPSQAVAFEDSPNGILAAKRAGLFCVAVPNTLTSQLPLDQADLRLDSLSDLTLEELLVKIEQLKAEQN